MFNWLRKKRVSPKPAEQERVTSAASRRPLQQYVYPPVANGIPRFPVAEILLEHEQLIQTIRKLSENKPVFDQRYRPVINRYANYVYLLPASEAHHHRGAGGLLHHGLEVAKIVLQQSYDRLHGMQLSPQQRKLARERWLFAGFVAGLNHDIGKAASDMRVFSVSGNTWDPFSQSLAAWYQDLPLEDDRIYVSWRREGQDHRRMTMHLINHILLPEDLAYLKEIEPVMIDQIHQAFLGEKGPRNAITEMVEEGDRKSLTLDLRKSNLLSDLGPQVGQPLARHFVMAMKRLIKEGRWKANQPGSVLWVIGSGVYLVWPEMAEEVTKLLHGDKTPGIPSNPLILADVFEEQGLLIMAPNGNRLWRLWPSGVNAGEEGLMALRLKEPLYIMDLIPPSVPGEVREETYDMPMNGVMPSDTPSKGKINNPNASASKFTESPPNTATPTPYLERSQEKIPDTPTPLSPALPGILEEPPPPDPRSLEALKNYFAAGGLGGQSLMQFAAEISNGTRSDGTDYQSGPQLLLSWGERKFTAVGNLPEVIESMARSEWLVLNGNRRVHETPQFGKCLMLRERETVIFWRLVWTLGEAKVTEPSQVDDTSVPHGDDHNQGTEETAHAGSPPPQMEEEPEWVTEVETILTQEGPLDYDRVEELVKSLTGRSRKVMELITQYFLVNYNDGKLAVLRRKP